MFLIFILYPKPLKNIVTSSTEMKTEYFQSVELQCTIRLQFFSVGSFVEELLHSLICLKEQKYS